MKGKGNFNLALDVKNADLLKISRLILKHKLSERVHLFIGGLNDADKIRKIKRFSEKIKVSMNLEWMWRVEGIARFAVKSSGADALFAPGWYFPERGFGEAKDAGAEVQVYIYGGENLKDKLNHAAKLGADAVSTDYPLRILKYVKKREK